MIRSYAVYKYLNTSEEVKLAVWNKGYRINGYDPREWRKDTCGYVMKYSEHGKEGKYGWEIDHIFPESLGGSHELSNLQPLFWLNNRKKSNTYPWAC